MARWQSCSWEEGGNNIAQRVRGPWAVLFNAPAVTARGLDENACRASAPVGQQTSDDLPAARVCHEAQLSLRAGYPP